MLGSSLYLRRDLHSNEGAMTMTHRTDPGRPLSDRHRQVLEIVATDPGVGIAVALRTRGLVSYTRGVVAFLTRAGLLATGFFRYSGRRGRPSRCLYLTSEALEVIQTEIA
jgi:hypothetical protein